VPVRHDEQLALPTGVVAGEVSRRSQRSCRPSRAAAPSRGASERRSLRPSHSGGRSDASEGVAHESDQGTVAEPEQGSGVDRGQQFAHLVEIKRFEGD
jgi:hypothetical protein